MALPNCFPTEAPPIIEQLGYVGRVWLVGGALRDMLLNRTSYDCDLAVDGDAIRLARALADSTGGAFYILDADRGTGRVVYQDDSKPRQYVDFAKLRKPTIEADLEDRDFTVNAMGIDPYQPTQLIDPCRGMTDLREGVIRACHADAMGDDAVRVLRAVRIATGLRFVIEPSTVEYVRAAAPDLVKISPERVRDELFRIYSLDHPEVALRLMTHLAIAEPLLQVLNTRNGQTDPWEADWESSLNIVRRLSDILAVLKLPFDPETAQDASMGLVSLYLGRFRDPLDAYFQRSLSADRDRRSLLVFASFALRFSSSVNESQGEDESIQKSLQEWMEGLRLSRDEILWLARCMSSSYSWMDPLEDPIEQKRQVHRFFRDAGDAGVAAVLLSLARFLSGLDSPPAPDIWERQLQAAQIRLHAYFESRETLLDPPRIVDGTEVAERLGIQPGPAIGRLLEAIQEAQAIGTVRSKEQALELADETYRSWKQAESGTDTDRIVFD